MIDGRSFHLRKKKVKKSRLSVVCLISPSAHSLLVGLGFCHMFNRRRRSGGASLAFEFCSCMMGSAASEALPEFCWSIRGRPGAACHCNSLIHSREGASAWPGAAIEPSSWTVGFGAAAVWAMRFIMRHVVQPASSLRRRGQARTGWAARSGPAPPPASGACGAGRVLRVRWN